MSEAQLLPTRTDLPVAAEALARLVRSFLAGKAEKTIEAYHRDLLDFAAHLGEPTIDAAARSLMGHGPGEANALALEYRNALENRDMAPATINRRLAALRSLSRLARTMGIVPWRVMVKNVRQQSYKDTRGPGKDPIRTTFRKLEVRRDPKGFRDCCIVRLLWDLGLRRCEVCRIDVADVDLEAGTLAVLGIGRREKQKLTLPEKTQKTLATWLAVHETGDGALFYNLHHD